MWSQVWSDAYAADGSKCGWVRTVDSSTGEVSMTLDVGLHYWEDLTPVAFWSHPS